VSGAAPVRADARAGARDRYPATKNEYRQILSQLETETVGEQPFRELSRADRAKIVRQRLKEYCSKTYKRVKDTVTEQRTATVGWAACPAGGSS
jgi:hypothetical protein